MCGRYYIEDDAPFLSESPKHVSGEIFPAQAAPVIANSRLLKPRMFLLRWGYSLGKKTIINARSEGAAQSSLFSDGIKRRRCIVPASFYFEWHSKTKVKYSFGDARGNTLYMAGVYRLTEAGGEYAVLTRSAGSEISDIHPRMPVLLSRELSAEWLNLSSDPIEIMRAGRIELAVREAEDEFIRCGDIRP